MKELKQKVYNFFPIQFPYNQIHIFCYPHSIHSWVIYKKKKFINSLTKIL